ncbi:hypothetical protein CSUB01_09380 [Colletotrichum sublineola]|uniref:Uncharacterized protein n=1 Tax=Colletotrichum sublineola TaxID=1173701 RepID=A0A066XNE0_COLSU|nr:hypothetical protein CSUB01_09380 [Colletotrichum sublineola]
MRFSAHILALPPHFQRRLPSRLPTPEHNGVSIPAFSLSAPCEVKGTDSVDCSSLIENNTGGPTFKAQLVTIDPESFVTISGSFGFTAGGTSHSLVTWITGKENGPVSFSAPGFAFDGVNGSNMTLS